MSKSFLLAIIILLLLVVASAGFPMLIKEFIMISLNKGEIER